MMLFTTSPFLKYPFLNRCPVVVVVANIFLNPIALQEFHLKTSERAMQHNVSSSSTHSSKPKVIVKIKAFMSNTARLTIFRNHFVLPCVET